MYSTLPPAMICWHCIEKKVATSQTERFYLKRSPVSWAYSEALLFNLYILKSLLLGQIRLIMSDLKVCFIKARQTLLNQWWTKTLRKPIKCLLWLGKTPQAITLHARLKKKIRAEGFREEYWGRVLWSIHKALYRTLLCPPNHDLPAPHREAQWFHWV